MKKTLYRLITGLLLAGWMFTIFLFSGQPAVESAKVSGTVAYRMVDACNQVFHMGLTEETMEKYARNMDHPVRKAAHMTEYAILGLLSFFCLAGYLERERRTYLFALGIAICYAASDEIHQLFVPGRAGRFGDVCIDTAGAALGLIFLFFLLKMIGKHCEKKKLPLQ